MSPMFPILTRGDAVSFFSGRGKKTAWDVWNVFPELNPVLKAMLVLPEDIEDTCLDIIERFVILLYDRTNSLSKVNEVRQELFSRKARSLENIPPTQASPMATYEKSFQGGFLWGQTLLKRPTLPSPSRWGWQPESNHWVPHWTTLSQAKDSVCYKLIRCGCKAGCRGRCKCQKSNLTCTGLCNGGGNCS